MLKPIKSGKFWRCTYCEAGFPEEDTAQECIASHDLILVPIAKNDLGRLIQFIYIQEPKLITSALMHTLQKYSQHSSLE